MTRIICGDALRSLRLMEDASVQCCVSSPPYWGLRDYGTASWEGGDTDCDHFQPRKGGEGTASPINGGGSDRDKAVGLQQFPNTCRKCGARRIDQQLGLERSPEEYVARLVAVFREVKRVLRKDGTLWLNLGDSYAGGGPHHGQKSLGKSGTNRGTHQAEYHTPAAGLKPKDLVGIPWRVAFALQADGWYLRSDIIWAKPDPMPESVQDRPTKAHEYIFLLAKSRKYYYDADAVKEIAVDGELFHGGYDKPGVLRRTAHRNGRVRLSAPKGPFNGKTEVMSPSGQNAFRAVTDYRNRRNVWTVTSHPYKGAHFATFPPKLIEPCILAGCPPGGLVLDPFAGAGTTGLVARQLGRAFTGIELNSQYCAMARRRIAAAMKEAA